MSVLRLPLAVLVGMWLLIVVIVNPVGEFMINDDWSYVRALEGLISDGRLTGTGWGPSWAPGGPSLVIHLLWGRTFTWLGGASLTALRVSVLVAGVLGSVALFVLCRMLKVSGWSALWASLALVANPLFLSQSFTFMTDVTFVSLTIFSLLFLQLGLQTVSLGTVAVGMFLCLCSVLTRQIGIVLPVAFVLTSFLHPLGTGLGRLRTCILAAGMVLVPWLAYEFLLFRAGGTSLIDHQTIHHIWRDARATGFLEYVGTLYFRFFHGALAYSCLLVSPVLCLRFHRLWASRWFRLFFCAVTCGFLVFEALLLAGVADLRVLGLRNVIFNMGIGPVLLKDTYILGIPRVPGITKPLYVILLYGSVLAVGSCMGLAVCTLRRIFRPGHTPFRDARDFMGAFSLLAALMYLGIITLTGFHDRYLIPVCLFLVVWLVAEWSQESDGRLPAKGVLIGAVPLLVFGLFSVTGTADFMALKRAQKQAQDYMIQRLGAEPCRCDGGMEFNGYHCYRPDLEPVPGLSWWWVKAEDYVLTLGPLEGYAVVRTFPFTRYMGPDGAVYLLR